MAGWLIYDRKTRLSGRGLFPALAAAIFASVAVPIDAAERYPKSEGGWIELPEGDISFADEVVLFEEGDPPSRNSYVRRPQHALGVPDHPDIGGDGASLTLGCRGRVVLAFVDNALVNIEGPDLHVWEAGPDVEATELAISNDGATWTKIGEIAGSTTSVDIAPFVAATDTLRYISLQDIDCTGRSGQYPGADVDAVAAIGSVRRVVFDGNILFAFDKAELTEEAKNVISSFVASLNDESASMLRIDGHTDAMGSDDYNLDLSQRRAQSVLSFMQGLPELSKIELEARGAGESEPAASNETEVDRQRNRRVEIIVLR